MCLSCFLQWLVLGVVFLKRPSVRPWRFCSNRFSMTRVGGHTVSGPGGVTLSRRSWPRSVGRGSTEC